MARLILSRGALSVPSELWLAASGAEILGQKRFRKLSRPPGVCLWEYGYSFPLMSADLGSMGDSCLKERTFRYKHSGDGRTCVVSTYRKTKGRSFAC